MFFQRGQILPLPYRQNGDGSCSSMNGLLNFISAKSQLPLTQPWPPGVSTKILLYSARLLLQPVLNSILTPKTVLKTTLCFWGAGFPLVFSTGVPWIVPVFGKSLQVKTGYKLEALPCLPPKLSFLSFLSNLWPDFALHTWDHWSSHSCPKTMSGCRNQLIPLKFSL